jgi:hypothetical protein
MKLQIKDLNIYNKNPAEGVDNEYNVEAGEFRQPCLWYIASPRFTGKTYLVSKFLKQAQGRKNKTFNKIYLISPSFKSNEAYFKDYIDEADVFDPTKDSIDKVLACIEAEKVEWEEYLADVETYKEYLKVMKDKFDLNKVSDGDMLRFDNAGFLNGKKPEWKYDSIEPPKSCLILDDIISSKAISQSSGIGKCATLNRHLSSLTENYKCADGRTRSACGCAVIILSQSYRLVGGASRSLRENLSLFTVFLNRQPKQMEAIEDEIGASVEVEKFQVAYKYAVAEKFGSLTTDLKPFCDCLTFRKNLNKQIIFPDQVCTCGRCRKSLTKN